MVIELWAFLNQEDENATNTSECPEAFSPIQTCLNRVEDNLKEVKAACQDKNVLTQISKLYKGLKTLRKAVEQSETSEFAFDQTVSQNQPKKKPGSEDLQTVSHSDDQSMESNDRIEEPKFKKNNGPEMISNPF